MINSIYNDVINQMKDYIEKNIGLDNFEYISGGERRDWYFSNLIAYFLQKPHLTIYKDFGSENINNYKDIAEYTVTIEDDKIQVRKSTPLYSNVLDKLADDSISLDERAIYEKIKPSMTDAEIKALPDILYKNGSINNKYLIQIEGTEISIIRKLDTDG